METAYNLATVFSIFSIGSVRCTVLLNAVAVVGVVSPSLGAEMQENVHCVCVCVRCGAVGGGYMYTVNVYRHEKFAKLKLIDAQQCQ